MERRLIAVLFVAAICCSAMITPAQAVRAGMPEGALEQFSSLVVEGRVLAVVMTAEEYGEPREYQSKWDVIDNRKTWAYRYFRAWLMIEKTLKGEPQPAHTIEVAWKTKHVFDNSLVRQAPMNHYWEPCTELFAGERVKLWLRWDSDMKAWVTVDYNARRVLETASRRLPGEPGEYTVAPQPGFELDSREVLPMKKLEDTGKRLYRKTVSPPAFPGSD